MANINVSSDWGTDNDVRSLNVDGGSNNPGALAISRDRVGVGALTPVAKLHINGGNSDVKLRIDTTNADPSIGFTTLGQIDWAVGVDYSDAGKLQVCASQLIDTNAKLTITTGGNVGIGESSPSAKLDIVHSGSGSRGIEVSSGSDAMDGVVIIANRISAYELALLVFNQTKEGGCRNTPPVPLPRSGTRLPMHGISVFDPAGGMRYFLPSPDPEKGAYASDTTPPPHFYFFNRRHYRIGSPACRGSPPARTAYRFRTLP